MPHIRVQPDARPARLLRQRARAFFHHLPLALAGEEESVHEIRVAGRRLRGALPLLATRPEGGRVRRARRRLRALVRAAGTCRDLDVAVALFSEESARLTPSDRIPGTARQTLRRRLTSARGRRRARMLDTLLDHDLTRLHRDLRVILHRGAAPLTEAEARVAEARRRLGSELAQGQSALGDRFDPEALHDLRRRVRRLRYVVEVAAELVGDPAPASAPVKPLKQLQTALGSVHDAWVLTAWLERQAAAAERRAQPELAAEARHLAATCRERARAHHRGYLETGPGATVTQIVSHAPAEGVERRPAPLRLVK